MNEWNIFTHIRNFYGRFERPISSLSLVGGFIFDAVTLQRVDALWDNVWVVAHLLIVAVCIILINREDVKMAEDQASRRTLARSRVQNPATLHFWLVNVMQFFFGGILSTYLVFYFRSASLASNWPFLCILGLAFWANESLKREYVRLTFQIVLLYVSLFAFSVFLVPVVLHKIGYSIFLLSGLLSLVVLFMFLAVLSYVTERKLRYERNKVLASICMLFLTFNLLYFFNLIPPIPLSLKDSGVYHSIEKDGAGNYVVTAEPTTWRNFFILYDDVHVATGTPVFIYSAIFSPPLLNLTIEHHYQVYDPVAEAWLDKGTVPLYVAGGRDGGFRTYSMRNDLSPGKWRVNVETESGQIIGTIRFTVVGTPIGTLVSEVK